MKSKKIKYPKDNKPMKNDIPIKSGITHKKLKKRNYNTMLEESKIIFSIDNSQSINILSKPMILKNDQIYESLIIQNSENKEKNASDMGFNYELFNNNEYLTNKQIDKEAILKLLIKNEKDRLTKKIYI